MSGSGVVVGYSYVAGSNFSKSYPAYFSPVDNYTEHKLGFPSTATSASAQTISSAGLIAGSVTYSDNSTGVIVWTSGNSYVELKTGLPSGYVLTSAVGFLQNGSLLCTGTVDGANSLIVVPLKV